MAVTLQLRSPHISFSLAAFLRAIICTIRRFLTCKRSRCSDRGLCAVLNLSKLSLMSVSGLFSSAVLCNNTSEPSNAPGRVCATFWLAQGMILLLFSPPFLSVYLHGPVALQMIQTGNAETLKKPKTIVWIPIHLGLNILLFETRLTGKEVNLLWE